MGRLFRLPGCALWWVRSSFLETAKKKTKQKKKKTKKDRKRKILPFVYIHDPGTVVEVTVNNRRSAQWNALLYRYRWSFRCEDIGVAMVTNMISQLLSLFLLYNFTSGCDRHFARGDRFNCTILLFRKWIKKVVFYVGISSVSLK